MTARQQDDGFDLDRLTAPAEDRLGGGGGPGRFLSRRGIALGAAGAVVLVVVGVAYSLGYQRGSDVAPPPLIVAQPGPTKVPPENPGGMEIPHQDKLVYQRLAGSGEPAPSIPVPARLLPPPEEPLPRAPGGGAAAGASSLPPAPPVPVVITGQSMAPAPTASASTPPAPARATTEPSPPAAAGTPALPPAAALQTPTEKPVALATPPTAPAAAPAAPSPASTAAAGQGEAVKSEAVMSGAGDFRIQLGSFRSGEQAEEGWARVVRSHAELVGKWPHRVVSADLGSRGVFHRLQAGAFASRDAADAACGQLKSRKVDCLVVAP